MKNCESEGAPAIGSLSRRPDSPSHEFYVLKILHCVVRDWGSPLAQRAAGAGRAGGMRAARAAHAEIRHGHGTHNAGCASTQLINPNNRLYSAFDRLNPPPLVSFKFELFHCEYVHVQAERGGRRRGWQRMGYVGLM